MNKARSVDDIVKYFAEFDYSDEENVLCCTLEHSFIFSQNVDYRVIK